MRSSQLGCIDFSPHSQADGGSKCLRMCEKSQNCSVWSWHSYSNGRIYGGICHFFGDLAVIDTRLMYDWQKWIGGTCMSASSA